MKINTKKMIYNLTYIYIVFNFIIFINPIITNLIDYVYIFAVTFLVLRLNLKNNMMKISSFAFISSLLLIFLVIIEVFVNQYGCYDIFKTTIFVILSYFIFKDDIFSKNDEKNKIDIIYVITCLYLMYFLIVSYFKGTLLSNILSNDNNFFLLSVQDKNLSGLIILLFMWFCYSKKYKIGIILSILYTLFLQSRMSQIGLILFFAIEFLRKSAFFLKLSDLKWFDQMSSKKIFCVIMISQILIIGFSYYCTYYIPVEDISGYKESLMDSSNAMRVRGNVYAAEEIRNDPMFIIRGYDHNIKEVLGITDISNSTRYLGFRLVQPHSLLLNLVLRYGLIYSIIYLIFVSYLIVNYWNKNTFSCLLIYLFMNMVLHLLFSTSYLIFILFVLCSLTNKKVEFKE